MSRSVRFSDAVLINKNSGFMSKAFRGMKKAYKTRNDPEPKTQSNKEEKEEKTE